VTAPGWRESVEAYIRAEALPVDKFGHQPRLYALAFRLGHGMEFDDDILFAAAWMHDLGVFLGHRPEDPERLARWDHVPYTIARTKEMLTGWGFPASKLERVAEAIRTHQRACGNRSNSFARRRYSGAVGCNRSFARFGQGGPRYPV
jgi:uncharacterized protein